MSFTVGRRPMVSIDAPSTSGRSEIAGYWQKTFRRSGAGIAPAARSGSQVPARAVAMCDSTRPPAGPSTILCSSLGKERKKLAKVLKYHRKFLEKRLSALTTAEADAPVLSELLSELRILTARLETQRAASLLQRMDDSDSSDSDDDDCATRSASSLCYHRSAAALQTLETKAQGAACTVSDSEVQGPTATPSTSTRMVVSTLAGEIELPVPPPQEGWDWDEEDFRAAKFEGVGGRVLVCTGSKCQRKGATEVLRAVSTLSEGNPNIEVVPCKCVGKCSAGAALRVRPVGQACATYTGVRPAQLPEVFAEHFSVTPAPPDVSACGLSGRQEPAQVACCVECQRS